MVDIEKISFIIGLVSLIVGGVSLYFTVLTLNRTKSIEQAVTEYDAKTTQITHFKKYYQTYLKDITEIERILDEDNAKLVGASERQYQDIEEFIRSINLVFPIKMWDDLDATFQKIRQKREVHSLGEANSSDQSVYSLIQKIKHIYIKAGEKYDLREN